MITSGLLRTGFALTSVLGSIAPTWQDQPPRYAELVWTGEHTAAERLALLEQHRVDVLAQMAEVQESLDRIDFKIAYYYKEKTT